MHCPRCGNYINNEYNFCNNCGLPISNHGQKNSSKFIYIILTVILIIAIITIIVILFSTKNKSKDTSTKLIERTIIKEPQYNNTKMESNNTNNKSESNNINTHINNNIKIEDKKNTTNNNTNNTSVSADEPKKSIKSKFSATASSYLNPQDGFTYYPENLLDNNLSTAWNLPSRGIGEWVVFKADQEYLVNGISIMNGYTKSEDIFSKNNRVKDISIFINDKVYNFTLSDQYRKNQDIKLSSPELTDTIKIQIDSVYDGNKYDEACISEVDIY